MFTGTSEADYNKRVTDERTEREGDGETERKGTNRRREQGTRYTSTGKEKFK